MAVRKPIVLIAGVRSFLPDSDYLFGLDPASSPTFAGLLIKTGDGVSSAVKLYNNNNYLWSFGSNVGYGDTNDIALQNVSLGQTVFSVSLLTNNVTFFSKINGLDLSQATLLSRLSLRV